jgi:hypothetical protein
MPRVIDTFMFRDELDMLECRLRTLDHLVDQYVIVESALTHRGQSKPLHYLDHAERFAPWADKITHVTYEGEADSPWDREHQQRDAALVALRDDTDPFDMVLISDVDEFPPLHWDNRTAEVLSHPAPVAFSQKLCMYAVDWLYPEPHRCSVMSQYRHIEHQGSLAALRDQRDSLLPVEGGWHFTWLGGVRAQQQKLAVTCHTEMTADQARIITSGRAYEEGAHHSGGLLMEPVEVDDTWPTWIAERKCPETWFRPRP